MFITAITNQLWTLLFEDGILVLTKLQAGRRRLNLTFTLTKKQFGKGEKIWQTENMVLIL